MLRRDFHLIKLFASRDFFLLAVFLCKMFLATPLSIFYCQSEFFLCRLCISLFTTLKNFSAGFLMLLYTTGFSNYVLCFCLSLFLADLSIGMVCHSFNQNLRINNINYKFKKTIVHNLCNLSPKVNRKTKRSLHSV